MSTTLLLLHGFPHDHTLWAPQIDAFQGTVHVLTPDLRGFGRDERPVPGVMTMDAYADEVIALLDEQGIGQAVIAGLSMGGYVALSMVERYPHRVKALVLCNTRATADDEQGRAGREATAQRALEQGMGAIARGMVQQLLSPATRQERPELAAHLERMMARQRPDAVAAAARGMALRPDRLALLPRIKAPTLVITGAMDTLMPLPSSTAMADRIPGSRLVIIPGAAHLSNLEDPDAFNAELARFLADVA
ncbi:MAG: alpha/beta fold hydrolase [Flavobacteriales bacterium]